jgi:hypothetical protein
MSSDAKEWVRRNTRVTPMSAAEYARVEALAARETALAEAYAAEAAKDAKERQASAHAATGYAIGDRVTLVDIAPEHAHWLGRQGVVTRYAGRDRAWEIGVLLDRPAWPQYPSEPVILPAFCWQRIG